MRIWSRLKEKRIIMVKGEKGGGRGSADLEKVIVAVSLEASRLPYIVVQPPEILHLSFHITHTHTLYLSHPTPLDSLTH